MSKRTFSILVTTLYLFFSMVLTSHGSIITPLQSSTLPDELDIGNPTEKNSFEEIFKDSLANSTASDKPAIEKLKKIEKYVQEGKYDLAIKDLQTFVDERPQALFTYEIIGSVYLLQGKIQKAEDAFSTAASDPSNSSALTKLGILYLAKKDFTKAEETLKQAVTRNPQDRIAYQRLGILAEINSDREKAITYYEKGVANTPSDYIGIKVNLGNLYNSKRQFDKTIALLSPVIAEETNSPAGHIVLGTACLYSRLPKQALAHFNRAAKLNKEKGLIPLGIAYRSVGEFDNAEKVLREATHTLQNTSKAYFELAQTAAAQKKYQEARDSFSKAGEQGYNQLQVKRSIAKMYMLEGKHNVAIPIIKEIVADQNATVQDKFVLSEAYQLVGNNEEAEKLLKEIVTNYPDKPLPSHRLAMFYGFTKNYQKAIQQFNKALKIDPGFIPSIKALVYAQLQVKNFDAACNTTRQLIKLQPENAGNYYLLATSFEGKKEYTEAEAAYLKALSFDQNHVLSLNNLANIKANTKDFPKALEYATKAVSLRKDNSRLLDTLGWIQYKSGDIEAAQTTLEKAHTLSPDLPVIAYHLGMVLYKLDDKNTAKTLLRKSITTSDKMTWDQEVRQILKTL